MKFLFEKGEVYLGDTFLSPRLVKDILEKKFNVSVIHEGPNHIKLRIIRLARLYGFPFIWPQASIKVWIDDETDKLIYEFFWPEYLALIIPFLVLLFIEERVRDFIGFYAFAIVVFGLLMFLDTRWVSRRVRKAFESV